MTRPERTCARAACGKTFRPATKNQSYCESKCCHLANAERRLAPNTPRHQLVRQLSEEAVAMLERVRAEIRTRGPLESPALAALVGRPVPSVVRVLNTAMVQGHIVREGLRWALTHGLAEPLRPPPFDGVTVEDMPNRGVLMLTRHRPGQHPFSVCLSRRATPEQVAATRTRLEKMP